MQPFVPPRPGVKKECSTCASSQGRHNRLTFAFSSYIIAYTRRRLKKKGQPSLEIQRRQVFFHLRHFPLISGEHRNPIGEGEGRESRGGPEEPHRGGGNQHRRRIQLTQQTENCSPSGFFFPCSPVLTNHSPAAAAAPKTKPGGSSLALTPTVKHQLLAYWLVIGNDCY